MTDADREPFAKMLASVFEVYGKPISASTLEIWWAVLQGIEFSAVRDALGRHCADPDAGQYLPKPADVVRHLGGTTRDVAVLAWALVAETVRRVGGYQSVEFEDPIIHAVVRDLGGWSLLCSQTDREWPFWEKRFLDGYRAYRVRGLLAVDVPARLDGRFEAHNALKGHKVAPPVRIACRHLTLLPAAAAAPLLPAP